MSKHFVSKFYLNLFECKESPKHIYRMMLPELRIDSNPKSTKNECTIPNYNTETQETQSNQFFENRSSDEIYSLIEEVENSRSSHNLVKDAIITRFICFLKANNPTFRESVKASINSKLYDCDKANKAHHKIYLRDIDAGFKITNMFTELMMNYFSEWKFIIAYNPDENVRLVTSDNPVIFIDPDNVNKPIDFKFTFGIPKELNLDNHINISIENLELMQQKCILHFHLTPNICVSGYPDWDYFEEYGREYSLPQVFNQLVFLHANNRLYSSQRSILIDVRNEVLNSGKYNYDKDIVKKEYGSE